MKNLGRTLRELRENKRLPMRVIAAFLDIDPAIMSRIERGQRKASREQVIKLADYFQVDENELLVAWLSDKVVYELADEQNADEHIAKQISSKCLNSTQITLRDILGSTSANIPCKKKLEIIEKLKNDGTIVFSSAELCENTVISLSVELESP
jgi:transcriptional regulator with XRE-family HTH domain